MIKNISFLIVGLLLGSIVSSAFAKYETTTLDAGSVVGYGKNGSTLVPILVDSSGVLQTN